MSELDDMLQTSTPIEEEKSEEQQSIETEQRQEDYHLAALKDHPGWKQIKKQMQKDIDSFNNFTNIDMSKYTDKELGEVVRSEKMVAAKLQSYLKKIDEAVRAVVIYGEQRRD